MQIIWNLTTNSIMWCINRLCSNTHWCQGPWVLEQKPLFGYHWWNIWHIWWSIQRIALHRSRWTEIHMYLSIRNCTYKVEDIHFIPVSCVVTFLWHPHPNRELLLQKMREMRFKYYSPPNCKIEDHRIVQKHIKHVFTKLEVLRVKIRFNHPKIQNIYSKMAGIDGMKGKQLSGWSG